jgi:glycosyltransferase involved in cell wall biosynthesis
MIRATLLTPNLSLGGAERWLVSLIKYSDPLRIDWRNVVVSGWGGADPLLTGELAKLTTLACNDPGNNRPKHAQHFDLTHFKPENIYKRLPEAVSAMCDGSDVLVTWGAARMGQWCKDLGIPLVLCSHTTKKETDNFGIDEPITHLTGVSKKSLCYFDGRKRLDWYKERGRMHVIYNGADVARVVPKAGRAAERADWGVTDNDVVIGYIGRQSDEKNYLAAARSLFGLPDNYKAVYYGGVARNAGVFHQDLLNLKTRLGDRLILRHTVLDVGDPLAGLDVFMLASHREAFSLGLIEAWLAGVPVVATPVGSVPELEAIYGPLVTPVGLKPTVAQLAAAVTESRTAAGVRTAVKAHNLAHDEFTCEAMAARWATYLEGVVREGV